MAAAAIASDGESDSDAEYLEVEVRSDEDEDEDEDEHEDEDLAQPHVSAAAIEDIRDDGTILKSVMSAGEGTAMPQAPWVVVVDYTLRKEGGKRSLVCTE